MANKKLTDLTELTTPADNDFLYIVDVSDTTESAQGTSKKIRKDKVDSGASKENIANKQNSLAIDGTGTKYPTVDAVNSALPTSYSKIVYVNAASPTTATIFDLENPPITNDNLLKNDTANLYIGTDASTWVYLTGTGYVTKTISSATSNFNTFGTTTDAGNSKTSHITRSGPVTLTGSLNLSVAKISTTPNTSSGSYDVLTRNSSTTALEKKLVSDFLQTTGNQSFNGIKTGTSTTAAPVNITLVNENNFAGAAVANFTNSAISSTNSTSALLVSNDNVGGATSAIQMRNNSSGFGGFFKNLSTGIGVYFENWSSGIGFQFDSRTGSTGDLIRFTKNASNTTVINHLGEITTMTPTSSGQVSTKGYVDAKITQTITNGVTDKSPSEDAVFDALNLKVNLSGNQTITGVTTLVGVAGAATSLDVKNGNANGSMLIGADVNAITRTNGVRKLARFTTPSFSDITKNHQIFAADFDDTTSSKIYFGGTTGSTQLGCTEINFVTVTANGNTGGNTAMQVKSSGAVTINTTTDDGIATNKLQVNGNITSNVATLSNQVVVKSQLDAIRPYKIYTALMTQSGTSAPVATVLENTLGGTVVWTRTSSGSYVGTLAGAFVTNKTVILYNASSSSFSSFVKLNTSNNTIDWQNGSDDRMLNNGTMIEIRVYN